MPVVRIVASHENDQEEKLILDLRIQDGMLTEGEHFGKSIEWSNEDQCYCEYFLCYEFVAGSERFHFRYGDWEDEETFYASDLFAINIIAGQVFNWIDETYKTCHYYMIESVE